MPRSAARLMKSGSGTSISAITGHGRSSDDLVDQLERVFVVVVQLHERDVGLVLLDLH